MITLSTSYLGPCTFYKLLLESETVSIEAKEHYIKQSFRNRCYIYGANGKLPLSIPIKKWKNHTSVDKIEIAYEDNWQKMHLKSIESAYRTSPFFEFYEADLMHFYNNEDFQFLLDFNLKIQEKILGLLKVNPRIRLTEEYTTQDPDWRKSLHPKNNAKDKLFHFPEYIQVFQEKYGFISNLSIIDVLFNLGPRTIDYLNSIELKK